MASAVTLDDGVRPHANLSQVEDGVESIGAFCGRGVHLIQGAVEVAASKVYGAVCVVFIAINEIRADTGNLNTVLRGLANGLQILQLQGHKVSGNLSKINPMINLIEVLGTFVGIYYFVSGDWKEDSPFMIAGSVCMTLADIGGAILWLGEMGVPFDKVVNAIGNVRFLGFISSIPVGPILTAVVGVGFTLFGMDGLYRLYQLRNISKEENARVNIERRQAVIDIAWAGVEITGKVAVIASAVFPAIPVLPILLLGLAAAGIGTTAIVHKAVFA